MQFLVASSAVTPRKLANAEIRFTGGALDGLTLPGFAVWVNEAGNGETVTFSLRQFTVSGQPRSFSLGRWIAKREAQERMARRRDALVPAASSTRNRPFGLASLSTPPATHRSPGCRKAAWTPIARPPSPSDAQFCSRAPRSRNALNSDSESKRMVIPRSPFEIEMEMEGRIV